LSYVNVIFFISGDTTSSRVIIRKGYIEQEPEMCLPPGTGMSDVEKVAPRKEQQPRSDYREFLELVIFLGATPPKWTRFREPGASHHARFVAKANYCL